MTEALKSCVGREVTYSAPEPVGRASIRYFAVATGDTNPLYSDEAVASLSRHGGVIAPPTMVCETAQFYTAPQTADGYLGHRWDLPIESDRNIRGGNEYEFFQPVRPDDSITVTWRIVDIYERETRKGGSAIFVISEARYVNQRGELLAINRETMIR
ncbi:MAG TPA: MaoC family dehydratase N-terminal domain-containing protein [Burkholderiales bacterium]|nr:MaoC family dehydratase N-terminal domain-containing protein [Burkholderiales bacterium]